MLLEISQNSQENTCATVSFFDKVAGLRHLLTKLTSETNSCIFKRWNNKMFFLVKQPLAAIKIMEAVINRCFLKKAKSKKVGKIH